MVTCSTKPEEKDKLLRSMKPLIPEPRHRVPPKGVASGISFRDLPAPSLCAIRKICEHYEAKCSGQYSSLASRYVLQMGNEIRTQIGAITKSSHDDNGGDAFRLENEVYPPRPPRDESRADASGERAEQTGHGIPSRDARIAALVKKIDGYKRAEVEAKQELKRTKENVAKRLEVKLQEYKEKTQVDLLHYKNSLDLIKRTHEEELKTVGEEVIQVKKDARLIIDFIRRKANEAIADGASKNAEQKKKMTESLEFQELQMKKSFSAHLEKFEEQVKNVVRGEKIAFQTEMTHTPTTKMNLRMSRIPKSPTRDISLVPKNPIVEEIFSDDSISMEDTITNAVQDAKYNHSTDDNSKMLKSRIELLEQWTDTLTIALRSGAAIKGLTEDSSPPCDEISWGNKDAGEGRAFVPRSTRNIYNRRDDDSETPSSLFGLVPPSPPPRPLENSPLKTRWRW